MTAKSPAGATSRKAQAARTETALKDAARKVFAEKGFLNAKISDISAAAGRASGSFYNHFPSKESILEALLTDWISEAGRSLAGHGDSHDLSDPEHLRWHVAVVWHMYKEHRPEIRALQEAAIVNEDFARRLAELQLAETRVLREHLHDMERNGVALPGAVDLVAAAMMALLNEFSRGWLITDAAPAGRVPDDDEAIDTLTAFVLHGIAGADKA
ncbi:TetR/AcrR family transcriptional regulator [Streptomyces sp. NPDC049687]|uniref:TetR/AcrR family transcriptional regulator n=1 Tax=Streptomyces sp. NPDC049687 TaxID=3365596 RepID=UPI0037B63296